MNTTERHKPTVPTTNIIPAPVIDPITGQPIDDRQLRLLIDQLPIHAAPFDRTVAVNWIGRLYFDTVTPYTAARNLRREISGYFILQRALTLAGWDKRKRHFTPRQISILFHFLGSVSAP